MWEVGSEFGFKNQSTSGCKKVEVSGLQIFQFEIDTNDRIFGRGHLFMANMRCGGGGGTCVEESLNQLSDHLHSHYNTISISISG